ncbi:MAG: amidohydrolase [Candidatus Glassbacteria bacterium]|nr:amidohydrolase [Candidatus Glassbacteria bacterium]
MRVFKTNYRFFGLRKLATLPLILLALAACGPGGPAPDTIYYNANVVTVDSAFSVAQAVAIHADTFMAVGGDREILALAGAETEEVDLDGRMVLPGLIEAHAHPERASLSEQEMPLDNPRTVRQCLDWVTKMVGLRQSGEWIIHDKLFATRLAELRPPSLAELDSVAPDNPVFLNGSYGASINSAAMVASGITNATDHPGLLRDPETGRLSGKLRYTALHLLKRPQAPEYSLSQRVEALKQMFALYNRAGFTSFTNGAIPLADTLLYSYMEQHNLLTVRAFLNVGNSIRSKSLTLEELRKDIARMGVVTGHGGPWWRIGALKHMIDGGILTGTAWLRQPWGPKAGEIFGVVDPEYRGIPRMDVGQFTDFARAAAEAGWKVTAHATGGASVDLMLEGYDRVNREVPIPPLRCSIIHGNFYTAPAMEKAARLGVIADMQPAWFFKDGDAMLHILGPERIKTFHPYRSMIEAGVTVSAGSDHMVILDAEESINPYSPWLAIYSMVTRRTERGTVIVPEEAISREDALRCYTINNAYASFEETSKGSIEPGKLADMIVIDRDYLSCPVDEIRDITVARTVLGGRVVYRQ